MKHPLRIVVCKEGPYNLITALGHFSVILQPRNICKVKFCDTSSASKTARKIAKILQFFCFQLEFELVESVKYSWCHEFSKEGTFFWLAR